MTPDEHAAEAERILTAVQALADPTTLEINANLARAHIHALLATRPTPPAALPAGTIRAVIAEQARQAARGPGEELRIWGMNRAAFDTFARGCVAERYGGVPGEVGDALAEIADRLYGGPAPTTET